MVFSGEPEDVDRLLWCSPPTVADDNVSFEFEFADQSLPDVYKMPPADAADGASDDWVLFEYVSAALSVKSTDALAKLLDDENAVMAVPSDRFNERAVPATTLGRQRRVAPKHHADSRHLVVAEQSRPNDVTGGETAEDSSAACAAPAAVPETAGEQIVLVRYDHKLKRLLGVDAYTVS